MLVTYPSWDNPIFVEWRYWRDRQKTEWTVVGSNALDSIERIANHIYKDGCVVGHMIMECDLAEMEAESTPSNGEKNGK